MSRSLAVVGFALTVVSAGMAKDGDVLVRGACTKSSTSKLKLSRENGRVEVEFEVDQNRNGVTWQIVLERNGTRVFRGSAYDAAAVGIIRGTPGRERHTRRRSVPRSGYEPVRRGVHGARIVLKGSGGNEPGAECGRERPMGG